MINSVKNTFSLQCREDGPLTTPHINKVLTQFRQRAASEAVTDPGAQPERQCLHTAQSTVADPADPANEGRIRKLEHQVSQLIQQVLIQQCRKPLNRSFSSI